MLWRDFEDSDDSVEYLKRLSCLLQSWDSVFLWLVPVVNPWSYPHSHTAQIFPILASAHPSSKSCVSIMINVIVYDTILKKDSFQKEKIVFYFILPFIFYSESADFMCCIGIDHFLS